jgi:hypothetical protein
MFDIKRKIYFIHIPKTAGQSVIKLVFTDNLNKRLLLGNGKAMSEDRDTNYYHLTYQELFDRGHATEEKMEPYYLFTVVRNPWARAVSQWAYGRYDNLDFPTFVDLVVNEDYAQLHPGTRFKGDREVFQYCRPQSDYIYYNGKRIVENIMKVENLEEDFKIVREKYGITEELPRINRSRHKDFRDYYTDELIEKVGDYYAKDVDNFGYTFESGMNIDLKDTKCKTCGEGNYVETSLHDDWHGKLHCEKCKDEVNRWPERD